MTAENEVSFSNLENLKPGEHIEFIITDQNGEPATIGIERARIRADEDLTRVKGPQYHYKTEYLTYKYLFLIMQTF